MCGGVPRLIDKLRIILCRHEACADIPVAAVIILRATYGILLLLHTTPYSTYFFILCSIRYFALYVLRIRTGIYSAACAYSSGCHDLKKAQPVAHTLTCRGTTCGGGGVGPVTMRRWPHRPASHGSLQGSSSCFLCDQRSLAALCGRHLHSFSVLLSFLLLFFTSSSSPPLLHLLFLSPVIPPSSPVLACITHRQPLTILKPRRVDGPVNRTSGSPGAISVSPLVETLSLPCDLVRWF